MISYQPNVLVLFPLLHNAAPIMAFHTIYNSNSPLKMLNHIKYSDSYIESEGFGLAAKTTRQTKNWRQAVKGTLKAELKRRDVTYSDLAKRLGEIGVQESDRNLSNKIGRGTFTAIFLFQCLEAIGCKTIHLGDN